MAAVASIGGRVRGWLCNGWLCNGWRWQMGPMGGEKERRGVRGEREITVRESVNEERAHEIPK